MPRLSRKSSSTQTYHVILRGIDKRNIFLEKDDYKKFLYYILKSKEKSNFSVYAYCLMSNHVHMLIKSEEDTIGNIMRRITVGYAQYHNNKYVRTGHLFQNRFKSEPIDDSRYFLTVLRYIHQNPIKAGMGKSLSAYPWSSYHEYVGSNEMKLIDTTVAMEWFTNIKIFKEFIATKCEDTCLEYSEKNRYTDESLIKEINKLLDMQRLQTIDINSRNKIIKKIKLKTKASNRQLSRVLGVGRGIIDRVIKENAVKKLNIS